MHHERRRRGREEQQGHQPLDPARDVRRQLADRAVDQVAGDRHQVGVEAVDGGDDALDVGPANSRADVHVAELGDAKSFQGFDRFRRVILHAPEDDETVARGFDLVVEHLEAVTETERGDLGLDQPLGGLRQRALRLADADRQRAALGLAGLDEKLAEEMRFA